MRGLAAISRFGGFSRNGQPARHGFKAAAAAAAAQTAFRLHVNVTDFHARAGVTVKEFAFEVGLVARVRVRAADEASARGVVSSVIGAPGSAEITLANEGNAALGSDAVVTAVDFIADRKVKLVRR